MSLSADPCHAVEFESHPPTRVLDDGAPECIWRGANFVVAATRAHAGTRLGRAAADQCDEYVLLLPEGVAAQVSASGAAIDAQSDSLTIVPPGDSEVVVHGSGWVYRVFSSNAADLLRMASNASSYDAQAARVAPLETWPLPEGGYRIRHHRLSDHVRTDTPMRLFRTRHLMLNVFVPSKAPRDVRKMTPHAHADFEQGSLALRGEFIHHVRYPWVADMTTWRADEHDRLGSPSLIVIPPTVVHTSQSFGTAGMRLVDLFAPPRDDFSLVQGLVCNAADYPLPPRLGQAAPVANAA